MINEAFASKRLAQLAKEHGGIKVGRNGGLRDGTYAYYGGNGIDLSKVTDDMLYGEPFEYSWETASNEQRNNSIHFNDGYAIALKPYNLAKNDNIDVPGRKQKPSRYFTGIGDTGDHDKKESPFFKDGKRDVGPQYNGFGISSRAGESQNYREAFKNNKEDYEYFKLHPERSDAKDGMRRAASNMSTIRGYGKQLLNKNENKDMDKNVVKLNEAQLKKIVAESVKKILKEFDMKAYKNSENYAYRHFLYWAFNGEGSRTAIAQDIWGYYDASVHHNESDAQWYFDEILRIYANGIGCEESELNIPAIKTAINHWGAYNYQEDEDTLGESKLNESKLKKIVAESVKKVLSEIDWKTANRAADIQSKWKYNGRRGGWDRYSKFRDYSDDEANLKFFGQKGGVDFIRDNDNDEGVSWVGFKLGYPQVRINDRDKFGVECQIVPTCIDYCHVNPDTLCAIERFTDDGSSYYRGISNEEVRKYFGEESELYQRFMEAVQEYTDLKNYKYRYDDKQGWHLKESVEKAVKSVLKEYLNKK